MMIFPNTILFNQLQNHIYLILYNYNTFIYRHLLNNYDINLKLFF